MLSFLRVTAALEVRIQREKTHMGFADESGAFSLRRDSNQVNVKPLRHQDVCLVLTGDGFAELLISLDMPKPFFQGQLSNLGAVEVNVF